MKIPVYKDLKCFSHFLSSKKLFLLLTNSHPFSHRPHHLIVQNFQIYGRNFSSPAWQKGLLFTRRQSNGEILIYFKVMVVWWRGLNSNVNSFVRCSINSQITMNEIALHQSKELSMNGFSDCARGKNLKSELRWLKARKHAPLALQVWFYVDADIFRDRIDVNLLARERKQFRLCWTPEFETVLISKAPDHVFVSMQKPQFKTLRLA